MENAVLRRFQALSLRSQLFLMAILLALPAFALIVHSGLQLRRDAINEGFEETRKLVYSVATEQYNLIGDVEQLLTVLAQLPEVKGHDISAASAILADVLKKSPQYGNVIITDRDGNVWASARPRRAHFSLKERRTFQNTVSSRRFSSGEYFVGRTSGRASIGFGYPVIDARGELDGVIAANINFSHFNELLKHAGLPKGTSFSIIDHNGVIINRNLDPEKFIGTRLNEDIFLRMKNGADDDTYIGPDSTGEQAINSYRKLRLEHEQSPYLYIRTSIPLRGIQGNAARALIYDVAFLSLFLGAVVLVAVRIGNHCFVDRIGKLREAAERLADGDPSVRVSEIVEGGELGSLAKTFDEMARKLTGRELALVKSEGELNDLYNNAPCGYHSLDGNGTFVRINDTELGWLGYTRDEVVGKMKFADILTAEGAINFEVSFPLLKTRGYVSDMEFEFVRKDGSTLPVLLNATALYERDGSFLLTRSTSHDITERKGAERVLNELNQDLTKRVEEETERRLKHERILARHARLAAIGEMIGAIAHQWRQPLATLGATIQSIRMAWERQCIDNEFLAKAESDAQKQLLYMSETIEDFRNFFSPEKVMEVFDAMEKVREAVLLVSPQFAHSSVMLDVVDELAGCPVKIQGYQNEFKQALLNLLSNSFDAVSEKCGHGDRPGGDYAFDALVTICVARRGENVVIEVRDNGCGIPSEHTDKVFEPYFTSKSEGKGTGIGLYMSKLIVEESMGGRLGFTSRPDGTVFVMELTGYDPAKDESDE